MTVHAPIRLSEAYTSIAPRRLPVEEQEARLIELAEIRIHRRLTLSELEENERLERCKAAQMNRPAIASLRIGSATGMLIDPTIVSVRATDAQTFRHIVSAREALIMSDLGKVTGSDPAAALTQETMNLAMDAWTALNTKNNRGKAISRLGLTAAMAITALVELEGYG